MSSKTLDKLYSSVVIIIRIENLTVARTCVGIELWGTSNSVIFKSTIMDNHRGIYLDNHSNNNSIISNNIVRNREGIGLYRSSDISIINNTFTEDGLYVYDSFGNLVRNNIVNGKPLVYLENVSDYVIKDAGQVILVGCNHN